MMFAWYPANPIATITIALLNMYLSIVFYPTLNSISVEELAVAITEVIHITQMLQFMTLYLSNRTLASHPALGGIKPSPTKND